MWMIFMKRKADGRVFPCEAKWPKETAQAIADDLNGHTPNNVEYYIVEEGSRDDPYTCNAGQEAA